MPMTHRIIAISFCLATLAGCTPQTPEGENGSSASSATTQRPLSVEGEFCGGIAAFQCAAGLTCNYDGTYPDAGGTCVKE